MTAVAAAKSGPQRRSRSAENQELWASDAWRMAHMKVAPCYKRYAHDWSCCPFGHPREAARRRDPSVYHYTGIACPSMKQDGRCKLGDVCPFAHNVFEYWLHPTRYRTQLCNDGADCRRWLCFFAHSLEQLRVPESKPWQPSPEVMAAAGEAACRQQQASPPLLRQEQQAQLPLHLALGRSSPSVLEQGQGQQYHHHQQQQQQQRLSPPLLLPVGARGSVDMLRQGSVDMLPAAHVPRSSVDMHMARSSIDMHMARSSIDMHMARSSMDMRVARGSMDRHAARGSMDMRVARGSMDMVMPSADEVAAHQALAAALHQQQQQQQHPHHQQQEQQQGTSSLVQVMLGLMERGEISVEKSAAILQHLLPPHALGQLQAQLPSQQEAAQGQWEAQPFSDPLGGYAEQRSAAQAGRPLGAVRPQGRASADSMASCSDATGWAAAASAATLRHTASSSHLTSQFSGSAHEMETAPPNLLEQLAALQVGADSHAQGSATAHAQQQQPGSSVSRLIAGRSGSSARHRSQPAAAAAAAASSPFALPQAQLPAERPRLPSAFDSCQSSLETAPCSLRAVAASSADTSPSRASVEGGSRADGAASPDPAARQPREGTPGLHGLGAAGTAGMSLWGW